MGNSDTFIVWLSVDGNGGKSAHTALVVLFSKEQHMLYALHLHCANSLHDTRDMQAC